MRINFRIAPTLKRFVFLFFRFTRNAYFWYMSDNRMLTKQFYMQPVLANGNGKIFIADGVSIGQRKSPGYWSSYCYLDARSHESQISIGANTKINNNFCIIANEKTVEIGENCLIGNDVVILNSDFHAPSAIGRADGAAVKSQDVKIGSNVFIGSRCIILKNTVIADGCTVAAGSIVTGFHEENKLINNKR